VVRDSGVATCSVPSSSRDQLGPRLVHELLDLVRDLARQCDDIRVLVLTGMQSKAFLGPYDPDELATLSERSRGRPNRLHVEDATRDRFRFHATNQLLIEIESLPFVTIAALNGHATGAGFEVALACDFRLAVDRGAVLGLPEILYGIIPGAGGIQRLARLVGPARALDLIAHGSMLSPVQALELGLVHRVFPRKQFTEGVARFARKLARRQPTALTALRLALRESVGRPRLDALALEQRLYEHALASPEATKRLRDCKARYRIGRNAARLSSAAGSKTPMRASDID
jgi:enoyl-CoA hydratase